MKKSIAALSLITIVTGGFLSSCSGNVNYEDGVVIKIGDKRFTIDDVYREIYGYKMNDADLDYTITQTGAQNYYNLLNNLLIQLAVPTTVAITRYVDNQIENDYYQTAKNNASTNGTSESEEREKILATNNVETVEELRAKFLLARKTTRNSTNFYSDTNYTALTPEYVKTKSPYHVRHILVNVTAAATDITNASISEDNANHIYNVVSRLVSDETFGQVAQTASDDSSASTYGDVGIMDFDTSFVSEFKYGLYGYDAYYNAASNKSLAKERLSIPAAADEVIGQSNFGIPLSELLKLGEYADVTTDKDHLTVDNASEKNYPRNVIFSQYLNNHGSSYIYLDKDAKYYQDNFSVTIDESKFQMTSGLSSSLKQITYNETTKKNEYSAIAGNQKILCDESQRPILVTRAGTGSDDSGYQGIHFIIAQRSPFVDMGTDGENIDKYYTLDIPSVSENPATQTPTYINFVSSDDRTVYTARAKTIRDELQALDSNMEFRIYEANKQAAATSNAIVIDSKVDAIVERYISNTKASAQAAVDLTYNNSWDSYLDLLSLQQSLISRVLPTSCITEFESGEITKGGVCYVNY